MCDQNWAKFSLLNFEIWCSQGFWDTDLETHSRTDAPRIRMHLAPKVFGCGRITRCPS